jgi:hypothetical protein
MAGDDDFVWIDGVGWLPSEWYPTGEPPQEWEECLYCGIPLLSSGQCPDGDCDGNVFYVKDGAAG